MVRNLSKMTLSKEIKCPQFVVNSNRGGTVGADSANPAPAPPRRPAAPY